MPLRFPLIPTYITYARFFPPLLEDSRQFASQLLVHPPRASPRSLPAFPFALNATPHATSFGAPPDNWRPAFGARPLENRSPRWFLPSTFHAVPTIFGLPIPGDDALNVSPLVQFAIARGALFELQRHASPCCSPALRTGAALALPSETAVAVSFHCATSGVPPPHHFELAMR
jgi:hypothetical protein